MTVGLPPVADANVVIGVKVCATVNEERGKDVPAKALETCAWVAVARRRRVAARRSAVALAVGVVEESIAYS